jgi:hypothetical protein
MLANFIFKQDLDIVLLQDVMRPEITAIQRYMTHTNLRTEESGTAILTKDGLRVYHVKRIRSGRGIVVDLKGVWFI